MRIHQQLLLICSKSRIDQSDCLEVHMNTWNQNSWKKQLKVNMIFAPSGSPASINESKSYISAVENTKCIWDQLNNVLREPSKCTSIYTRSPSHPLVWIRVSSNRKTFTTALYFAFFILHVLIMLLGCFIFNSLTVSKLNRLFRNYTLSHTVYLGFYDIGFFSQIPFFSFKFFCILCFPFFYYTIVIYLHTYSLFICIFVHTVL